MKQSLKSAIILWVLFIGLSLWPVHASPNPLELKLNADRTIYKTGDLVRMKMEFYNNSEKPLIIYTGLLPDFNLNVDIVRMDGGYEKKLSWPRRLYDRSEARKDEFVTLPPYGTHKDNFLLQDYMDEHVKLLEKGTYKLTVRYSNDLDGYQEYQPYSFIKLDAWKGKAASNPITITIQ